MDNSQNINNKTSLNSPLGVRGYSGKQIAKYLAIISISIVLIVSVIMILNFVQIKIHHPIESETVDNLVKKLANTDDEQTLREEIRVVDLLARKAYFSYLWQLKTGAWIAIISALVFVFSLRYYLRKDAINPANQEKTSDFWLARNRERKWLIISVSGFAIVAFALSFATRSYYTDFRSFAKNDKGDIEMQIEKDNQPNSIVDQPDSIQTDTTAIDSALVADFPTDAEIKQNHPAFRGPYGLGISYKTKLPTDWNGASGKNIKWKKAISLPGLNSPVVWGNQIFISGADEKTRKVFCYNRLNGSLLWTAEAKGIKGSPANSPKVTNDTGHSAAGLTTDGKRVYAIFSNGDLIAIDNATGQQVWAKNIGVPDNHYGHSSSLQFYKDKLIIQFDDNKSCKLIAFATQTGEEIWKTVRSGKIAWSSPIIVPKGNSAEIIVNNLPYVAAYNAETGKEKWKVDCLSGEVGSSPGYGGGLVFAANEYAKMVAIKDGKIVWEGYDYLPDVSSPVAYKDMVFFATSYGDLVCFNQSDGAKLWHHEFDNGFYGSPVVADGKLYCIDRTGTTVIVDAAREFKLIGQPELGEKSDCTPAFANGVMYIRGQKNLYCIGN